MNVFGHAIQILVVKEDCLHNESSLTKYAGKWSVIP